MIGNVASQVQYGQTAGGVPMANFRLAATERRYDRARGEWVDGDTTWVKVTAWRWLAANVVSSLEKGQPVMVSGRLKVREWEDEGKRRSVVEIDARSIGHDLGRGTSAFRWSVRGRGELPGAPAAAEEPVGGLQTAGEAVPEWIMRAVRERRAGGGQEAPALAGPVGVGEPESEPEMIMADGQGLTGEEELPLELELGVGGEEVGGLGGPGGVERAVRGGGRAGRPARSGVRSGRVEEAVPV
ncbi:single-stranded DNA-binding protein [Kitasatospora sp. NPDC006697]|uniref:single-stranded DNA-binding protein n=1 Tax=Kitasatospora sp. NPDC006697 TaxID=3364020 RepID=UPI0036B2A51C